MQNNNVILETEDGERFMKHNANSCLRTVRNFVIEGRKSEKEYALFKSHEVPT